MISSLDKNLGIARDKQQFVKRLPRRVVVMPRLHQTLTQSSSNSRVTDFPSKKDSILVVENPEHSSERKNLKHKLDRTNDSILHRKSKLRPKTVDLGESINLTVDKSKERKSPSIFERRESISCTTLGKFSSKSKARSVDYILERVQDESKSLTTKVVSLGPFKVSRELANKLDDRNCRSRSKDFDTAKTKSKSSIVGLESTSLLLLGVGQSSEKDLKSRREQPKDEMLANPVNNNLQVVSQNFDTD